MKSLTISSSLILGAAVLSGMMAADPAAAREFSATGCSQSAAQAAIDAAADGDVVVVPSGNCTWSSPVRISGKGIHLKGQQKGAVKISHGAGSNDLLSVSTDASHHVEVSNLTFLPGSASGSAEYMAVSGNGKPALVHDNYFRNVNFTVNCIRWSAIGGVVWNNTFESLDSEGSSGGCFQLKAEGLTSSWTTASTMGKADTKGTANVYIENNAFKKIILQSIDVDDNVRAVIRYNNFDNSGFVYHGADTSSSGVRHVEVYNNKFTFTESGSGYKFPLNINWWVYMRGGTGIWADNDMDDIRSQDWGNKPEITMTVQNVNRRAGPFGCWGSYPAPHQVGQSHNGISSVTDPVYIWGNTGTGSPNPGISSYSPNECGNSLSSSDFIKAGRDYVVGNAKSGYAKYPYPHPLVGGAVAPTPDLQAPTGLQVQ